MGDPRPHAGTDDPEPYTLCGLDRRDLALIAEACTDRADFLAHLATGHYSDRVAHQAGYRNHRHGAADDADRLLHIANALHERRRS